MQHWETIPWSMHTDTGCFEAEITRRARKYHWEVRDLDGGQPVLMQGDEQRLLDAKTAARNALIECEEE